MIKRYDQRGVSATKDKVLKYVPKIFFVFLCLLGTISSGCKKDLNDTIKLSKIKFTYPRDTVYNIYIELQYDKNSKIKAIAKHGEALGVFFYYFYYSTKLDSMHEVFAPTGDVNNILISWNGNKISSVGEKSYTYDANGNVGKQFYSPTSYFRYDYSTDSIRLYASFNGEPELQTSSYLTSDTYKNPFIINNNESEALAFGYVTTDIFSGIEIISKKLLSYDREYQNDLIVHVIEFKIESDINKYPTKINVYDNGSLLYILDFMYEV